MKRSKTSLASFMVLAIVAMSAFAVAGAQATPKVTHNFFCLDKATDSKHVPCHRIGFPAKTHREFNGKFPVNHQFSVGLGIVECETVESESEESEGTSENLTSVENIFEGCLANPGGTTVHWNMNGCFFEYFVEGTQETTSPPEGYEKTEGVGSATLFCPTGKTLTIDVTDSGGSTKCHIEAHAQNTIKPIYFRNKKEPITDVTIEAAEAKLVVTTTGGIFNCGVSNGEHEATYTANTTWRAFDAEGNDLNVKFDDGKAH